MRSRASGAWSAGWSTPAASLVIGLVVGAIVVAVLQVLPFGKKTARTDPRGAVRRASWFCWPGDRAGPNRVELQVHGARL